MNLRRIIGSVLRLSRLIGPILWTFQALFDILKREGALWVVAGSAVWLFLLWPSVDATLACVTQTDNGDTRNKPSARVTECLKPVAKELRESENLAVYAAATIAATIAWRLNRR